MSIIIDDDISKILEYQKNIPVPIVALSNHFNIEVFKVSNMSNGISGAIIKDNNKYTIYTNKNEPENRRRFTIAHELAHFLLHKNIIDNQCNGNLTDAKDIGIMYRSKLSSIFEREANILASEILMPIDKLKSLIYEDNIDSISKLSDIFQVSKEAIRIRTDKLENKFLIKDTIN